MAGPTCKGYPRCLDAPASMSSSPPTLQWLGELPRTCLLNGLHCHGHGEIGMIDRQSAAATSDRAGAGMADPTEN